MRVYARMSLLKDHAVKDWVSFAAVHGMPLRVGNFEPAKQGGP
jgi:hypothetical protein